MLNTLFVRLWIIFSGRECLVVTLTPMAVGSWASCMTSLSLSFPMCKMEGMLVPVIGAS